MALEAGVAGGADTCPAVCAVQTVLESESKEVVIP